MTPFDELLDDLAGEQEALGLVLARLTDAEWHLPTHAPGWLVRDQITRLGHFDETATLAIVDAEAFRADVAATRGREGRDSHEARYMARGRALAPGALADWWREAGARLVAAARTLEGKTR